VLERLRRYSTLGGDPQAMSNISEADNKMAMHTAAKVESLFYSVRTCAAPDARAWSPLRRVVHPTRTWSEGRQSAKRNPP